MARLVAVQVCRLFHLFIAQASSLVVRRGEIEAGRTPFSSSALVYYSSRLLLARLSKKVPIPYCPNSLLVPISVVPMSLDTIGVVTDLPSIGSLGSPLWPILGQSLPHMGAPHPYQACNVGLSRVRDWTLRSRADPTPRWNVGAMNMPRR